MNRRTEWIAGLVLAAFGIVAAFAMLEVGVRFLHLVPDRFWEPDPLLGARLIPGASGWWSQEEREFLVPVTINSRGLHDFERDHDKPASTTRILVLGDSFTEALHVPFDDGFTKVLERQLNRDAAQPVEVLNSGVSGYGTASETLYFENEGWRYQPDAVLLAFYPGNDIRNNSPTLEDAFRPVYAPDGALQSIEPTRNSAPPPRSAALRFLRQLVLNRQPGLATALVKLGLFRPDTVRTSAEVGGIPVGYGMYAVPPGAEWQDAWNRTAALLDRLRRAVESRGARFAMMVVTSRERIYPDTWDEVVRGHPAMAGKTWDMAAPEKWVIDWCRERGVQCLEMTSRFQEALKKSEELLHYRQDGHWTVAGHKLAGLSAATFVEDLKWIEKK